MKRLFTGVTICLITLAILEIGLRVIDPWGAFAYYADMWVLRHHYVAVDDSRAYTLPVGTIDLHGWSVNKTADGRAVPDSGQGDCTLAFVGDSYTFGHGVSDQDTFANQIAQRFPSVTVRNLGENGYNTAQVLATVEYIQADAYVYLIIGNDAAPVMTEMLRPEPMTLTRGLQVYQYYVMQNWRRRHTVKASAELPNIPTWFDQSVATLATRDDVLMVAFEHEVLGQYVANQYPETVTVPKVRYTNSPTDGHPNTQGHQEIADGMAVYLPGFIQRVCEDAS